MTTFDDSELVALAVEFGNIPAKAIQPTIDVIRDGGSELRDRWKQNARETSGAHARLYPGSITASTIFTTGGIVAEIGPITSLRQGFLGPILEFGGIESPPHLDGQRAADEVIPHLARRMALAAEDTFHA